MSPGVEIGDKAVAIGNPLGLDWTLSTGVVSRIPSGDDDLVQSTAPISHGSSGGGLFDATGRLIGITRSSRTEGQNLNFAVRLSVAEWTIIGAARRNVSFEPNFLRRGDWIVGEHRWDGSKPLDSEWTPLGGATHEQLKARPVEADPEWDQTYRKTSRFARYMKLTNDLSEKKLFWDQKASGDVFTTPDVGKFVVLMKFLADKDMRHFKRRCSANSRLIPMVSSITRLLH